MGSAPTSPPERHTTHTGTKVLALIRQQAKHTGPGYTGDNTPQDTASRHWRQPLGAITEPLFLRIPSTESRSIRDQNQEKQLSHPDTMPQNRFRLQTAAA